MVGTRNLARPFFEKIEKSTPRKKGYGTFFSRTWYAKKKFRIPPKKMTFFFSRTPKFSSQGNRRGDAYPPNSRKPKIPPKNEPPPLGGYGTFFFAYLVRNVQNIFFAHLVREFRGTSVPEYRIWKNNTSPEARILSPFRTPPNASTLMGAALSDHFWVDHMCTN